MYRNTSIHQEPVKRLPSLSKTQEKLMRWIRRKNMNVLTYTVKSQILLSKAFDLGVDGIFLDDPHLN